MNRPKNFAFFLVIIVSVLSSMALWTLPVQASYPTVVLEDTEESKIKEVVQTYFDIRYSSLNTLQLEDFSNVISEQPNATAFLNSELGKLTVEIKHAELNRLRYVDYEFFLNFKDILIDDITQTAVVSLLVNHDVVYEVSVDLNPTNPIVSHMA